MFLVTIIVTGHGKGPQLTDDLFGHPQYKQNDGPWIEGRSWLLDFNEASQLDRGG